MLLTVCHSKKYCLQSTDRAGIIVREYVWHSLYDHMSTRPFLTPIEKKWIWHRSSLHISQRTIQLATVIFSTQAGDELATSHQSVL